MEAGLMEVCLVTRTNDCKSIIAAIVSIMLVVIMDEGCLAANRT